MKSGFKIQNSRFKVLLLATCILLLATVGAVNAEMQHSLSHSMKEERGDTITSDGVKAVFKLSQTMSMVDIVFSDVKTGNIITKAKVSGMATNPDSTKQTKEFVGMKMDKEYSFGNTLDLSQKGVYKLDVDADIDLPPNVSIGGGKRVKFSFKFEVR